MEVSKGILSDDLVDSIGDIRRARFQEIFRLGKPIVSRSDDQRREIGRSECQVRNRFIMILFRFASVEIVKGEKAMRCHLVIITVWMDVHVILCSSEQREKRDDIQETTGDRTIDRIISAFCSGLNEWSQKTRRQILFVLVYNNSDNEWSENFNYASSDDNRTVDLNTSARSVVDSSSETDLISVEGLERM